MNTDIAKIPHWTRVAFAVRCVRRVEPLFRRAWPNASSERVEAIETAIALSERSSVEKRVCDGVEAAVLGAVMAAGQAMFAQYPELNDNGDEPSPVDADKAAIASFVANSAGKAAETPAADPANSAPLVMEAYHFALDAVRTARANDLRRLLIADYEATIGTATRRSWWKFW